MFTFVLKAENMSKISIVGIGPGDESSMTPEALAALQQCDVVVGYKYYFQFIKNLVKEGAVFVKRNGFGFVVSNNRYRHEAGTCPR